MTEPHRPRVKYVIGPDGSPLTIADLPPRLAREAHDWTLRPKRSEANFAYYARRAFRNHPDALSN